MKILITSDWYTPAINGVVTSILNLQKGLEERGHEVRILTLSQNIHSDRGKTILALGSISLKIIYPGARLRVATSKKVMQEIINWHPDIIHSQCEFNTFMIAKKLSAKLNIPLIHTYHTVYEDYTHYFSPKKTWGKGVIAGFSRYISKKSDCMIVPTDKVREILAKYRISCPVETVPTGIELGNYRTTLSRAQRKALMKELQIPSGSKIGLYLGRIAKEKNLTELLTLWKNAHITDGVFLIVGDGPYLKEIKEKIQELNLEKSIRLVGRVEPAEVWKYYQLGDFFLNASNSETQGLTYIEAMASGLPLLCRKDPCLDQVIKEGINGWQYVSADDFNEHLKVLLSKIPDQVLSRDKITREAQKFSIEAFAEGMETIYLKYTVSTQWKDIA